MSDYFDGQFRRKNFQSLGGSSNVNNRSDLLRNIQLQRTKRVDDQIQRSNILIIQSNIRRYLVQKHLRQLSNGKAQELLRKFDEGNGSVEEFLEFNKYFFLTDEWILVEIVKIFISNFPQIQTLLHHHHRYWRSLSSFLFKLLHSNFHLINYQYQLKLFTKLTSKKFVKDFEGNDEIFPFYSYLIVNGYVDRCQMILGEMYKNFHEGHNQKKSDERFRIDLSVEWTNIITKSANSLLKSREVVYHSSHHLVSYMNQLIENDLFQMLLIPILTIWTKKESSLIRNILFSIFRQFLSSILVHVNTFIILPNFFLLLYNNNNNSELLLLIFDCYLEFVEEFTDKLKLNENDENENHICSFVNEEHFRQFVHMINTLIEWYGQLEMLSIPIDSKSYGRILESLRIFYESITWTNSLREFLLKIDHENFMNNNRMKLKEMLDESYGMNEKNMKKFPPDILLTLTQLDVDDLFSELFDDDEMYDTIEHDEQMKQFKRTYLYRRKESVVELNVKSFDYAQLNHFELSERHIVNVMNIIECTQFEMKFYQLIKSPQHHEQMESNETMINLLKLQYYLVNKMNRSSLKHCWIVYLIEDGIFNKLIKILPSNHLLELNEVSQQSNIMTLTEQRNLIPIITMFTHLLLYHLLSVDDIEMHKRFSYDEKDILYESSLKSLGKRLMFVCLYVLNRMVDEDKIKVLKHIETSRSTDVSMADMVTVSDDTERRRRFREALGITKETKTNAFLFIEVNYIRHLFFICTRFLRSLHDRDERLQLFPEDFWQIGDHQFSGKSFLFTNLDDLPYVKHVLAPRRNTTRNDNWYVLLEAFTNPNIIMQSNQLNSIERKQITFLLNIPFFINFDHRLKILYTFINRIDRDHGERRHLDLILHRNDIYHDAFRQIPATTESFHPNNISVRFIEERTDKYELGIDGGGLRREFLHELLVYAFDPSNQFFKLSNTGYIYPNPAGNQLQMRQHFYFIGKMLGVAIYTGVHIDINFSQFFLNQILHESEKVDIHHLNILDPILYKNLLSLMYYETNVEELNLDFTYMSVLDNVSKTIELIENGRNVPVTKENRYEYILKLADYKLNKEFSTNIDAFRSGLGDQIDLTILEMFSAQELHQVICGTSKPIDVDDFRANVTYGNDYSAEHPAIINFWSVVQEMNTEQRGRLLKFITSCSKPPYFGFSKILPNISITPTDSGRLPTSSTCMNILYLPQIENREEMKRRLMMIIEHDVGFALS
ncbi:hypothetical protein SNEBB_007906 [Seison nebaliae]|nr:hypothetical protein SNEBB_007906 [Seison nebaliae]